MRKLIALSAAAILLVASATETKAMFVAQQTGNSAYALGFVSYAYYDNTGGGNWITDLGLGGIVSPGLDGLQPHVFFYQIARTDVLNPPTSESLTVPGGTDIFTSAGFLAGTVLSDGAPVVGSVAGGNNALGAEDVTNTSGADPTILTNNGVAAPMFVADGAAVDPVGVVPNFSMSGNLVASFGFGSIGSGGHSSVVVGTASSSAHDPFLPGAFAAGTLTPPGSTPLLPVANPEPGSLILLSMGMAGVVGYRRRKKKLELLDEEATETDA